MTHAARCPYCFTELDAHEPEVRCVVCGTPHHRACFLEHGHCVTLGCTSRESRAAGSVHVRARLEVEVGPERHPFLKKGGYEHGEPRFLDVEALAPERERVFAPHLDLGLANTIYHPGEAVAGAVSLHLTEPLRARAVRLLLRTSRYSAASIVPTTLLEREAVLAGFPWEGHLAAFGLAFRTILHREGARELITLAAGVTRWSFRFPLDPLHPVRGDEEGVSVQSELIAYVEVPAAGADLRARVRLHVGRAEG